MKHPEAPPRPRQKGSPRRRFRGLEADQRQAERRQKIIDAGIECFGRNGFHVTTVRQICAEARLTERYFYESFRNLEALFAATYERVAQQLRDRIVAAIIAGPRDISAMAHAGLHAMFESIQRDPRMARILFVDVFSVSAEVEHASRRTTQSFADLVKQMVESLLPETSRAGLDPGLISTALVGASINVAIHWSLQGYREPLETVVHNCAVLYEVMARHALTTARAPLDAQPAPAAIPPGRGAART